MAKLYQRQGVQLQRGQIYQPDKKPNMLGVAAKWGAAQLDEISKDNFALGQANLADSIVATAYESNPTDLKRFNEMVQSGILKSTKNLPGDMARIIRQNAEKKALALSDKIRTNYTNVKSAELEHQVQTSIDDIVGNGPMGLNAINTGLMEALRKNDNEAISAWQELWTIQKNKLSALAELKNPITGAYVIGNESARNNYKQALFGKLDVFRSQIEKMSKDELKNFDTNIFQDPKFMEIYDINDYATRDKMSTIIKNRRKEFDSSDKREIKDNAFFQASQLAKVDPMVIDDIEKSGALSKESIKMLREAVKWGKSKGSATAGINYDQDNGFLVGLAELQGAISTDDGSDDYNDKLIQSAAKISIGISQMRQNGLGDEQGELLEQALSGIVSDQNFADALDFNDSSLLSEIVRGSVANYNRDIDRQEAAIRAKYPNAASNPFVERQMVAELSKLPQRYKGHGEPMYSGNIVGAMWTEYENDIKFSKETKKALKKMAARYSAQIIALEKMGNHEAAMQIKTDANKELIYLKYGDWIPRYEFERLEKELKNGNNAYTTIGNTTFRYKGLSQKGVILEGEF